MEFFIIVLILTALSNSLSLNWVYPYDVQDIPEPFHQLYYRCSKHQSQLPRNDGPNTFYQAQEIPVGEAAKNGLLISLQGYLYSKRGDIQHAYGDDLCLLRLSISEHFHYRIFVSVYPYIFLGRLLSIHGTCILLPKQYGNLNYLPSGNCFDIEPFSKFKTFIETKVSAMKLQGFNL